MELIGQSIEGEVKIRFYLTNTERRLVKEELPDFNFGLYIQGDRGRIYSCSYINSQEDNCSIDIDGAINVIIPHDYFRVQGHLCFSFSPSYDDTSEQDGKYTPIFEYKTSVKLI